MIKKFEIRKVAGGLWLFCNNASYNLSSLDCVVVTKDDLSLVSKHPWQLRLNFKGLGPLSIEYNDEETALKARDEFFELYDQAYSNSANVTFYGCVDGSAQ